LTHAQKKHVKATFNFSRLAENAARMNYDAIVIDAALWEMFGYEILEGNVKLK
jgi:hypothetical protein